MAVTSFCSNCLRPLLSFSKTHSFVHLVKLVSQKDSGFYHPTLFSSLVSYLIQLCPTGTSREKLRKQTLLPFSLVNLGP